MAENQTTAGLKAKLDRLSLAVKKADDLFCRIAQLLDSHAQVPHEFSSFDTDQRHGITEWRMDALDAMRERLPNVPDCPECGCALYPLRASEDAEPHLTCSGCGWWDRGEYLPSATTETGDNL